MRSPLGQTLGRRRSGLARGGSAFLQTGAGGTAEFIQRQDGSYWKVITFTESGNLTVTGPGSADYLVVGGGGNGGLVAAEIEKSVTGENGNTGARLTLDQGTVAVSVGEQGAAGVAGGASQIGTVSAAGGSAS